MGTHLPFHLGLAFHGSIEGGGSDAKHRLTNFLRLAVLRMHLRPHPSVTLTGSCPSMDSTAFLSQTASFNTPRCTPPHHAVSWIERV